MNFSTDIPKSMGEYTWGRVIQSSRGGCGTVYEVQYFRKLIN